MMRRFFCICLLTTFCLSALPAAHATETTPLTQRDLMIALVNGLGWSFGLPDEPTDDDYLQILSGRRHLRLEVERLVGNDTPLITKETFSFGNFSGEGWLQGPRETVKTTLPFLLPLSGTYKVRARLMSDGFTFNFGIERLQVDGGTRLTDTDVGTVTLNAGPQLIRVDFPARGGMDFIELDALPAKPIAPPGGWVLERTLTSADLSSVALQLLDRFDQLPLKGETIMVEAEDLSLPPSLPIQKSHHLGAPSCGAWIRAGANPATLQATVNVPADGIYSLGLRLRGKEEWSGLINNRIAFQVKPGPALNDFVAGAFPLAKGTNQLTFFIPPFAGLDCIRLIPHDASPTAISRLGGLHAEPAPTRTELDAVIRLLAAFGIRR
jgi:hypothetical protein